MQYAFAKAGDEGIRYVRGENLAEIIERAADHGGKFMCRSMLRPTAPQLQTALPLSLCVHRLGLSRALTGPDEVADRAGAFYVLANLGSVAGKIGESRH